MTGNNIAKGFAEPVTDAQTMFRAVLTAMSEPGREVECPVKLPSAPLPSVMAAVALSLLDFETPLFLAGSLARDDVRAFLTFHTGAPFATEPQAAAFAMADEVRALPAIDQFAAGTPDYPDRSTTLIIGVSGFDEGKQVVLKGPGIRDATSFRAGGLDRQFWLEAIANSARFPLGVDCIFCAPHSLAALPRSTAISFTG